MAPNPDPTRRLRLQSAPRPATGPLSAPAAPAVGRHQAPEVDDAHRVSGWVPDWDPAAAVETLRRESGEPVDRFPIARAATETADDDEDIDVDPLEHDDIHAGSSRWGRLRDRWVPEPWQGARLDPGRRGSALLSAIAAVAAVAAAFGVWLGSPDAQPVQPIAAANLVPEMVQAAPSSLTPEATEPATMVVAVTGSVRQPGVVTLPAGSRVADAIAAAGGMLDETDYTGLNLAAKLVDGDSVVVGGATQGVQSPSGPAGSSAPTGSGLVHLNTADQTVLETLPGVGPVMAGNIITWRESNGPFTAVDQLQEVTGIGPSRLATLAPLVTVG